jgi:hypothetical protein
MEASEKPQLPLDPAGGGAVRAIGDRIVIEALTVTDDRAAEVVRDRAKAGQPPAETVRRAIEIGARVLDREQAAAEAQYVRHEFERVADQVQEGFGERAEAVTEQIRALFDQAVAGEGSALDKALRSHSDELAEQVARNFASDRSTAVQHQVKELVHDELLKLTQHLSSESEANPLQLVKGEVLRTIERERTSQRERDTAIAERIGGLEQRLVQLLEREDADRRVAEEAERGTAKGRSFEERVDQALERIAATRGDASAHTGGEGAEGGGRKGDTLIELGASAGPAAGRIVFEAKDKKLSKNDAWRELNEAMAARAASFAVLVVAGEDRVPSGRETLTEYEGNKLIVAVDREEPDGLGLEVAYRLAAARVAMARDRDLTVDAPAVRDAAEEAVSCLKQAQQIRASLTGIKTNSDKARATLDEMVESVHAKLERIDGLVEDA